MHLLYCTRTQVTLPGQSAQLAKHCGTCKQSCPAWRKCTASQVLRYVHTEMPCPKCRSSRELQYSNSEQAHPDQAQATDKATGRAAGTPGSPTQIGSKRKCTHQAALPGTNSFWPTRQHIKHHACPAQLQPTCQNHSAHSLHKGHFFKIVR